MSITRRVRPVLVRWTPLLLLLGLVMSGLVPLVPRAEAALPASRISLTAVPPATAPSGATVTMAGSVTNGVRGQRVQLQLRNGGGWTNVATARLPRRRTFSLSTPVFLGVNELRVVAKKVAGKVRGGTSATRKTNGLPVAPVAIGPGETFAVSGTLATPIARPVVLQRDDGGTWETAASGTSSDTGGVRLSTTQDRATTYRIVAPAATVAGTSYPSVTTKSVKVLKGPRTPSFSVSTLPVGYRNRIYNHFPGFGWYGGWSYSVVSGALPPGITLSEDGFLEGTPTTAGTSTFRVRIAADGVPPAERTFTLEIAPDGTWLDTDLDVQAVDNAGRYATLTCGSSCVGSTPPQVVDLATGAVQTATYPPSVPAPAAAQVEDISGNGRYVLYFAGRDNWSTDNPEGSKLFLWDRVGGTTELIADGGPGLFSGWPHGGLTAAVDVDGSTVVYELDLPGVVSDPAVFVWERGVGVTSLRSDGRIGNVHLTRPEVSDDGDAVSFLQWSAAGARIRLWDRSADTLTWVSPVLHPTASSLYTAAATGDSFAYPRVAGTDPDNGDPLWETVLWDRSTGSSQVVSKTVSGASMRFPSQFDPPTAEISGDGRFVYFESAGDFFEEDFSGVRLGFFWDRASGDVTPMPHLPGDPLSWPELYERWAETSYDGSVVFVRGYAGGLQRPPFRFQRDPRP